MLWKEHVATERAFGKIRILVSAPRRLFSLSFLVGFLLIGLALLLFWLCRLTRIHFYQRLLKRFGLFLFLLRRRFVESGESSVVICNTWHLCIRSVLVLDLCALENQSTSQKTNHNVRSSRYLSVYFTFRVAQVQVHTFFFYAVEGITQFTNTLHNNSKIIWICGGMGCLPLKRMIWPQTVRNQ